MCMWIWVVGGTVLGFGGIVLIRGRGEGGGVVAGMEEGGGGW